MSSNEKRVEVCSGIADNVSMLYAGQELELITSKYIFMNKKDLKPNDKHQPDLHKVGVSGIVPKDEQDYDAECNSCDWKGNRDEMVQSDDEDDEDDGCDCCPVCGTTNVYYFR